MFRVPIARQFSHPEGLAGRLVGRFMALTNSGMNRFAAELLDPQPQDRVLEIGFGPGEAIRLIAGNVASVSGIDPSEVMLDEARQRNRAAIRERTVELRQASISAIPYEDGTFDKVFTVNTIYFWERPQDDLREVLRVLKPEGRLVVVFRAGRGLDGEVRVRPALVPRETLGEVTGWFRSAGFKGVDTELRIWPLQMVAGISAYKPAGSAD